MLVVIIRACGWRSGEDLDFWLTKIVPFRTPLVATRLNQNKRPQNAVWEFDPS